MRIVNLVKVRLHRVFLVGFVVILSCYVTTIYAQVSVPTDLNTDTSGVLINGGEFNYLAKTANKPLVILFSGSLCPLPHLPNCEAEVKAFNELHNKYEDDFVWLQVVKGYYSNKTIVKKYLAKFGMKVDTIFDTNNSIFQQFKVHAIPYVVVVESGTITYRKDDFVNDLGSVLQRKLNKDYTLYVKPK